MKTSTAPSSPASAWPPATPLWLSLVLVLLTVLAYWGVWNCEFLGYDDPDYFVKNHHVLGGLTAANIKWAFTTGEVANWHPLTWLSLMLDVDVFGKGPLGPHLTNLILHVGDTVLLFWWLRGLTAALWRSFIVAVLFGLHPMHVESVAWLAERKDVLSAFFFFLTLMAYTRYVRRSPEKNARLNAWYWLSLVLFALGLMSKPMLVTLPFVLLLLDWWPWQRVDLANVRNTGARLVVEKLPFLLLSVAASVVTFLVQQHGGAVAKLTRFTLTMRVENACVAYGRYVGKTLTAWNLAVPYPFVTHWLLSLVVWSAVFFLAMSAAAFWLGRRFPFLLTGWFWFAGMLVPVIGLVQVGGQAMADRYNYLPSVGLFILLVWGGAIVLEERIRRDDLLLKLAGVGLLAAMMWRTHSQALLWRNDGSLFSHALAVTKGNYVAHINYGAWLSKNGDSTGALDQYNDALRLSPDDCTALYDVGNGLAKLGNWDRAIECYRNALAIKPDQADVLNNLGFALAVGKQWAEAVSNFEAALKLDPDYGDAHNNLASVLFRLGDFNGAAAHFQAAARQMPDNAPIQVNLGDTWLRLGRKDEAATCYRRALEIDPANERARAKLTALGLPALN